jgi:hypothetical protein
VIAMLIVKRGPEETGFSAAKSKQHDRNPPATSVPKGSETEDMFS